MTVSPIRRARRATLSALALGGLVAGSLGAGVGAASAADHPDYTNQAFWNIEVLPAVEAGISHDMGDLVITLKPGAVATDTHPIASVQTAPGAQPLPAGVPWRSANELFVWDTRVDNAHPSLIGPGSPQAEHRGWSSFPFSYADTPEHHIAGARTISSRLSETESGYFRFVIGFGTDPAGGIRPQQPGVYFYDAVLHVDKATGVLSVVGGPAVDLIETTTTLGVSNVTATGATLTAAVSPSAASGEVTFKRGTEVLGTAPVSGGTATFTATTLTAGTTYTAGAITAEYGGDSTHEASSASNTAAFSTLGSSATIGINVVVDEAVEAGDPLGLILETVPTEVTLGSADPRQEGAVWVATGTLGDVTVNDDRRSAASDGWTISGRSSEFASGSTPIPASALSWTPGTGGTGGQPGTLDVARVLSTGVASDAPNARTTITATGLSLAVPASADAGTYAATFTLTLI